MPKVGDRYKQKGKDFIIIIQAVTEGKYPTVFYKFEEGRSLGGRGVNTFLEDFEPLPNPESKEKLPEAGREYIRKTKLGIWRLESINSKTFDSALGIQLIEVYCFVEKSGAFDKDIITIPFDLNKLSDFIEIPSTNQQEESGPEIKKEWMNQACYDAGLVQKAKEELKREVSLFQIAGKALTSGNLGNSLAINYKHLLEAAQNLLNALESTGESNIPEKGYPIGYEEDDREKEPSNLPSMDWINEQIRKGMEEKGDCGIVEDSRRFNCNYCGIELLGNCCAEGGTCSYECQEALRKKINQVEEEKESEEESKSNKDDLPEEYRSSKEVVEFIKQKTGAQTAGQLGNFMRCKINPYHVNKPIEKMGSGEINRIAKQLGFEEEEKPKSIWKDVKELPESSDVIIQYDYWADKHYVGIVTGYFNEVDKTFSTMKGDCNIPHNHIVEYITLTDFINAFKDLQEQYKFEKQERIKLQERVKKLENK